jgi:hypothetical protein
LAGLRLALRRATIREPDAHVVEVGEPMVFTDEDGTLVHRA